MLAMIHKSFFALFAAVALFSAIGIDATVIQVNPFPGICVYVTSMTNDFDNDKNMEKGTEWSKCDFDEDDTIKDVKKAIEEAKGIDVKKMKLRKRQYSGTLSNSKELSTFDDNSIRLYLDKDNNRRLRH